MLNNSSCSDVTFVVEDCALYAHRCILMARCEPLEKMLGGRMREGSQSEIAIPEYSVSGLLVASEEWLGRSSDVVTDFVVH